MWSGRIHKNRYYRRSWRPSLKEMLRSALQNSPVSATGESNMKKFLLVFKDMYDGQWIPWFQFEIEALSWEDANKAAHAMLNREDHENTSVDVKEIK